MKNRGRDRVKVTRLFWHFLEHFFHSVIRYKLKFCKGSPRELNSVTGEWPIRVFGIFDVSQRTCSHNQCLVPLPLPLACSSRSLQTHMLPLPLSACFPRLAWICVPPPCQIRLNLCIATLSNTAPLPVPRFGAVHCCEYVRANSKHQEVFTRSIKEQRLLAVLVRTLVFVSN